MTQDYDSTAISDVDLMRYDDEFKNAPVEEREFDDVPDDSYQVNIEKAELVRAKSSGAPMLKLSMKILGSKCTGRMIFRNYTWEHAEPKTREFLFSRLRTDLQTCGVVIEMLSELPPRLGDLLDVKLEIKKLTKEGNSKIFINRRIVVDDVAASDDSLAAF